MIQIYPVSLAEAHQVQRSMAANVMFLVLLIFVLQVKTRTADVLVLDEPW